MASIDPSTSSFWITLGVAAVCGAIVGLERQLRGKPVDVRTSILICLGTAIFVSLGAALSGDNADPTRVLGQVVTGVGFLGAGVMLSREGMVRGVTTAAVIWILAAIGATVGFGYYVAAPVIAVVTILVLVGIDLLEAGLRHVMAARSPPGRRHRE